MLLTKPLFSQFIDAEEAQEAALQAEEDKWKQAEEDKWKQVLILLTLLVQKCKY